MDISKMRVADYLGKTIDCECGRTHTVEIEIVEISKGAMAKVPEFISGDGFNKPFIIADRNTQEVAGKRLQELLSEHHIPFSSYVFDELELVPDEHAVGKLLVNFDTTCDMVIAVGSGTINDISRFLSHRLGIPYYVVATAPSMDGYASTVAPFIRNNLKTTFECKMPRAIIADLELIASAPQEMIAAGFGDVIGKFTCLADWELSAIINNEYYCELVVDITRQSLLKTIDLREGIANGDQGAIGELMEALVLAGIGMSYVGNSRPASGSEHHVSHFWEMRFLFDNKPAVLHGIKVGLATILISQLYERLRHENLNSLLISQISVSSNNTWSEEVHRVFLDAAQEVIELENAVGKNSLEGHRERIKSISQNWERILEVLDTVPEPQVIRGLLKSVNGPTSYEQVGITHELVREAVLYGKEIRPRYTILQLLWDLNLLSKYANN